MLGMLEALKIVGFSVLCAVIYGILHDQVTAHVSLEYFTVAHPPLFPTEQPFLLAIGWGIIATWWVGLILGAALACSARIGPWPKLGLEDVRRAIVMLMIVSGVLALVAGIFGWFLTNANVPGTIGFWASELPSDRHARFAFAAWAHSVSYLVGAIGGIIIMIRKVLRRRKLTQTNSASSTYSG